MTKRMGAIAILGVLVIAACGDAPLGTLGNRSSGWINEPTVPATVARVVEAPRPVAVGELGWANDEILNTSFDSKEEFLAEVFGRREGDRFIQASRTEIAFAMPGVMFPGQAPPGAEWVSSQLVFDNDGTLSNDPSVAFGIWSAEPYTRSRSVAQMMILRVSNDIDGAALVAEDPAGSCARLGDQTTQKCEYVVDGELDTWVLTAAEGTTYVWFEGPYRYQLYGRTFVSSAALGEMRGDMIPLSSIEVSSG